MTQASKRKPNRRKSRLTESEEPPKVEARVRFVYWRERFRNGLARHATLLRWTGRAVLLCVLGAGAVAAGRLLEQHVRTAEAFATTEITVDGHSRLTREHVLAVAGLTLGDNVFEQSPEEARAALLEDPWVAEASVARRLPGSYEITLRERRPAAVLALEQPYLVADDGSVFKPLEPGEPADLPVITGVDPERFRLDRELRTSLLVSAVALLHDYRDVGLWRREPIAEIHVEESGGFALYVGEDAALVRLGKRPFRKKLRRFRGILDELRRDRSRPAYVYLDNVRRPDRVTVRLR
ncbi:MAG: FtsQ-type POTRA domain-containing protein [Myxococcales bacterium]|nr:FtsQ-type POTRA domain-containing protein [Myxococcales bacterium]